MQPEINSTVVIMTAPTAAHKTTRRSGFFSLKIYIKRKHMPPTKIIDGCVYPRHSVSTAPYTTPPMAAVKRYSNVFLIKSPPDRYYHLSGGFFMRHTGWLFVEKGEKRIKQVKYKKIAC